MADTAAFSTLSLPVDDAVLVRLHGKACITCGSTTRPLVPVGHVYTGDRDGGRQGWAVSTCPEHGVQS